tara:strand:- start:171 stop:608 length:438 start_codon:yes stop_codon:yes gene_type:complete
VRILNIFTKISVGLAGFSGIVVALRESQNENWHEIEKTRLIALIAASIMGTLAALLPTVLHKLEAGVRLAWQVLSVSLGTLTFVGFIWLYSRVRETRALQHQDFFASFLCVRKFGGFTYHLTIATLTFWFVFRTEYRYMQHGASR